MIAIIDYGVGNLFSVEKAFAKLGAEVLVTDDAAVIERADKIVLPGVGAFGDCMENLTRSGLIPAIRQAIAAGKPLLGICVGLQILFEGSDESPGAAGLGVFSGQVKKIVAPGLKIPHMGWNSITVNKNSRILKNIGSEPYVYFVHSYYVNAEDESIISAYTEYGQKLDIAVEKDNVFATQFHPEKSGETGMTILKNFIAL